MMKLAWTKIENNLLGKFALWSMFGFNRVTKIGEINSGSNSLKKR